MGDLLGIGKSALNAAQRNLDTIGHNIANVNTPNYSRQSVEMFTRPPEISGSGFIGSGVQVGATKRTYDQFINSALISSQATNSELNTYGEYIRTVDNLLGDSGLGLSKSLDDFFLSLNQLSNDPSSIPNRQLFLSQSQVLDSRFKDMDAQLASLQSQAYGQVESITVQINALASSIADINVDILSSGGNGTPNDLLDKQDNLISQLSELVNVTTSDQGDGTKNVFIGNGQALVVLSTVNTLGTRINTDSNTLDVTMSTGVSDVAITDGLSGGQIGGALNAADGIIKDTRAAVGRMATLLAMSFNDQHQKGIDLNGNQGRLLFSDPNAIDLAMDRAAASQFNQGNAVLSVNINSIDENTTDNLVFSNGSGLVNAGSLTSLANITSLSINGQNIRVPLGSDDTVSSSDNTASAIAIANAINDSSTTHQVKATAQSNVLLLGSFTPGAFAAGEFQINGTNVVTTGADADTLVQDINALQFQTGVTAKVDENNQVVLTAVDGRNIQVSSNTNTPAATFTYFDTNSNVALDQVKRAAISLESTAGPITIAGQNPALAGLSAGTTPNQSNGSLTTSDYRLSYDGSEYTLLRLSDQAKVAEGSSPSFNVDGFTINLLSGSAQAGDSFLISPTLTGAVNFGVELTKANELAMAAPVAVSANISNLGEGKIRLDGVHNTSGTPQPSATQLGNSFTTNQELTPPIKISFVDETTYRVFDMSQGEPGVQIGPDQSYDPLSSQNSVFPISGVVDPTLPGPNPTYVWDPGYTISLSGAVAQGDEFTVGFNEGAAEDNTNGFALSELQFNKMFSNNTATFQDSYAQIVSSIGTETQKTTVNIAASDSVLASLEARRNEVSGVNLEEEAANLIKFEQYYQASAQLIVVARQVFDALIGAFGR